MAKRSDTLETVKLAVELLRRIPRGRKVTASELHEQLQHAGIERELRTIQRQLEMLSEHFEIERDDRHRVVNVVQIGDVESRLFPAWNIRYLDAGFFHMIRMEDVLETVMLTMNERSFKREQIVATVLRIAKLIAKRKPA